MSEQIVQLNEQVIKIELKELVRQSIQEVLNNLLDAEADQLTNARKYERTRAEARYTGRALHPQIADWSWRSNLRSAQTPHFDI